MIRPDRVDIYLRSATNGRGFSKIFKVDTILLRSHSSVIIFLKCTSKALYCMRRSSCYLFQEFKPYLSSNFWYMFELPCLCLTQVSLLFLCEKYPLIFFHPIKRLKLLHLSEKCLAECRNVVLFEHERSLS